MENWDDYRYFLAVAEIGSVSAASRVIGTTQSTVGRRVAELERRLGTPLFLRSPTGFRLNDLGKQVLNQVRMIDSATRWIEEKLVLADEAHAGRVTLTLVESLAHFLVTPRLVEFCARWPDIELDVMTNYDAVDLMSGRADVALRVGPPGNDEYVGRRLGQVHFGLYAGHGYLTRHGTPHSLSDLPHHHIIDARRRIQPLPQYALLRQHAAGAKVAFSSDSLALQLDAACADLGLVALPAYAAAGHTGLRHVLAQTFGVTRDLWLLTHRDLRNTARVRAVLDFFGEAAAERFRHLPGGQATRPC